MTVHHESLEPVRSIDRHCPAPVSLETLAVIEQVFAETLRQLREKASPRKAAEAGETEYASWLRGARH